MIKKISLILFCLSIPVFADQVSSDWSMMENSEGQRYKTKLKCISEPSTGSFQQCSLDINDAKADAPEGVIKNAKVGISGGMPAHHHGLPTSPTVNWSASEESYIVEGLKFSMPGEWVLNFYIEEANNSSSNNKFSNKVSSKSIKALKDKVVFKFVL